MWLTQIQWCTPLRNPNTLTAQKRVLLTLTLPLQGGLKCLKQTTEENGLESTASLPTEMPR